MDEILTGGGMQCRRERLGMSREVFAAQMSGTEAAWRARGTATPVSTDMIRQCERSRDTIPVWMGAALAWLEAEQVRAVDELAGMLAQMARPAVAMHHSDEQMRHERLSPGDIPSAQWWRVVALAAAERVPGTVLGRPGDLTRLGFDSWV